MFNAKSSMALAGESREKAMLTEERAIMNTILAGGAGGIFTFCTRRIITGEAKNVRLDF
jgi:hypothetical protein